MAGSGLTSISLSISDSATNLGSRDVRFTSAATMRGVTVLGNEDSGFIHMQLDLAVLRPPASNASATASSAQSCIALAGAGSFDTITLLDIGFMGFRLSLDDIQLLSRDQIGASAAPFLTKSTVVPVLGDDMDDLKSGKNRCGCSRIQHLLAWSNPETAMRGSACALSLICYPVHRYLMKVRPNVTLDKVASICQELAGNTNSQRFAGLCHTPLSTVNVC